MLSKIVLYAILVEKDFMLSIGKNIKVINFRNSCLIPVFLFYFFNQLIFVKYQLRVRTFFRSWEQHISKQTWKKISTIMFLFWMSLSQLYT